MRHDEGWQGGRHRTQTMDCNSAALQGARPYQVAEGLVQHAALALLHIEGCIAGVV